MVGLKYYRESRNHGGIFRRLPNINMYLTKIKQNDVKHTKNE
jgi:hypothetical protein